jgi:hypothetical protein
VLVGVGDIGWCLSPWPEATAKLLDGIAGTVFAAGDIAYMDGTRENFRIATDPNWDATCARARSGNHVRPPNPTRRRIEYFGANTGQADIGYYSYDLRSWHIVALNSNIDIESGSSQLFWLRQDLEETNRSCILAYWHHPLFASGAGNGSQPFVRDLWRSVIEHDAEVVLNGHEHGMNFGPDQTVASILARGIVEFVVGQAAPALPA